MNVKIRITTSAEAEELAKLQRAAFKPLYEKFHDEGSPYLRGAEDILRRLNKSNRYYTILYDNKIVGGVFYRLHGKRIPDNILAAGDYYLARIYIHPDYQNKGIAREAIRLCEREFPDAKRYYVDYPEEMEKNRRCYESIGYRDMGERLHLDGVPVLAMLEKDADTISPADVSLPLIFEADADELPQCLDVIHRSFRTVAEQFGLTKENCPKHTSFMPLSFLETHKNWGWQMFALYAGKTIIGYMSLSKDEDGSYGLHNLAVLPEYRHKGFGKLLLDHGKSVVKSQGGSKIKIGIIEESTVLKNWYIANGFTHTGTKKFDHLPFTSGYLEWNVI